MPRLLLLAACVSVPALPDDSGIQGPVTGYVLDARMGAIRSIQGIPGASVLGPALPLGFAVRQAAIGMPGDFALAVSADDGRVHLVRGLAAAEPSVQPLDGALADPALIALESGGGAALLYSKSAGKLQILSGLPAEPRAGDPFDAPGGAEVTAIALASGGASAAAAVAGAVYRFVDGQAVLLAAAHAVSAMTFRDGGRDLVFANQDTNEIVLVRGIDGGAEVSVVAGETDGVSKPVGVQTVNGGGELWVANAGSNSALAIDLTTPGASWAFALAGAPTRCDSLDGKSLLVFNDAGGSPVLLADWARNRSVYFVPAEQPQAEESGAE